jgi:hypothetical protein
MVTVARKRNAINYERTLQNRLSSGHESTFGSLCQEQLITSQFVGYPAYLDTKNHRGPREGTKGEQGCSIIKEERNLKNVNSTYRLMSATNRNFIIKNKDLNLGHSSRPSKRYRRLNEMPKCQ